MKKAGIFLLTVFLICTLFAGCRTNVGVSPGIVNPQLRTAAPPNYGTTIYPNENYGYPNVRHESFGEGLLGTGTSVYDEMNGEILPGQTLSPYNTAPNRGTGYAS